MSGRVRPAAGAAVSASLAAAIAHGLRMTANLVVVKMIAVYVGPAGFGLLGNFMSLITMTTVFAGGGINTGITKYVAEYKRSPRRLLRFLGSTVVYGGAFSIMVALVTLAAATPISRLLFSTAEYAWLVRCVGLAHLLTFIGSGVIAVGNGLQRPVEYARITISGYLLSFPVAWILIHQFGLPGAGIALLCVMSCTGIPALWVAARSPLTSLIRVRMQRQDFYGLLRFSAMAITSAVAFPTAEITIRKQVLASLGADATGLWQATSRLSGAYMGFFTVFLATYYMPKLASMTDRSAQARLVWRYLAMVGGGFAIAAVGIFALRPVVIHLLFSDAFQGMSPLVGWQLLGDVFRVAAYVIGFLGIARGSLLLYVGAEVLQASLLTLLVTLGLRAEHSLIGVQHAYVATYVVYFCVAIAALVIFQRGQQAPRSRTTE